MLAATIICIFSYFMGAIPTGYWIGKVLKGIDIRKEGSCSTGATNVLRCVGKGPAVFVLIFDMFKGAFPVVLAIAASAPISERFVDLPPWLYLLGPEDKGGAFETAFAHYYILPAIVAFIALLAHAKSIFLNFGGGKSAATGLGALAAMNPLAGLCMFIVFVSTIYIKKYVSLGSIAAAVSGPFLMHYFTHGTRPSFVIFNIVGSSYVILRHQANIKRLLNGTEPKIGKKARDAETQESQSISEDQSNPNEEKKSSEDNKTGEEKNMKADEKQKGDFKNTAGAIVLLLSLSMGIASNVSASNTTPAEKPALAQEGKQSSWQAKSASIKIAANSSTKKVKADKADTKNSNSSNENLPDVFTSAPPAPVTAEEATNIRVYKTDSKAVVNVTTINTSPEAVMFGMTSPSETGSGSIISTDGYILTNNHVVNGASMVRVSLFDGTTFQAKLVGTDPDNDLAVLKIEPGTRKLATIKFGDSSRLEVGRRVYAIGNPFGLDLTMTSGIISSVGRTMRTENGRVIKGVLQTDAAINPGNSGGPLLDTQGNMIGVTTAILGKVQQSAGIGFAIPINVVKRIVPQLIAHGVVLRPNLGILKVTPTDVGLMITAIDPQGPAAEAGLHGPTVRRGKINGFDFVQVDNSSADTIIGVDSQRVASVDDLLSYVETKKPGQVVTLNVLRQGQVTRLPVKLGDAK